MRVKSRQLVEDQYLSENGSDNDFLLDKLLLTTKHQNTMRKGIELKDSIN